MIRKLAPLVCLAALPLMPQDRAVLYNSGSTSWTDLGPLPGTSYPPAGHWSDPTRTLYSIGIGRTITDAGVIYGSTGDWRAFQYSGGTMSTIASLPAAPTLSEALGASPNGTYVVGYTFNAPSSLTSSGFLYNGTTVQNITTPGANGQGSLAYAVNDSGVAVGQFVSSNNAPHAFKYSGTTLTDITPTAASAVATSINATGTVVGIYRPTAMSDPTHLFSYSSGSLADLGTGASTCGYSLGDNGVKVNDSGVIVASYRYSPDPDHPCVATQAVYYDGSFHLIPYLGSDTTNYPTAINNSGLVVGFGLPSGHPFSLVISGATLTDLGLSKTGGGSWSRVEPRGINASGQIVGTATP